MTSLPRFPRKGFIALIAAIILACSLVFPSCAREPEAITVAFSPFESTALMWIAEEQDFFKDNGLAVTYRKYDSGAQALAAVMSGEADVAIGTAEYPAVGRAFQKEAFRIISSVARADYVYLVARKDRNITQVSDLRGKRVGVTIGTISHFFLGRFFALNGLGQQDVTLVDLKTPEEWINSVAEGLVDAVATAQPYARRAAEALGDKAILWPAQSNQLLHALVLTGADWIKANTRTAVKYLEALRQAEEFLVKNPAVSKDIIRRRLELDQDYMDTVWKQNQFGLSLDQSLVIAMEDEARWMISNNLTAEPVIPDFLEYIDESALKQVKPEAVKLIR